MEMDIPMEPEQVILNMSLRISRLQQERDTLSDEVTRLRGSPLSDDERHEIESLRTECGLLRARLAEAKQDSAECPADLVMAKLAGSQNLCKSLQAQLDESVRYCKEFHAREKPQKILAQARRRASKFESSMDTSSFRINSTNSKLGVRATVQRARLRAYSKEFSQKVDTRHIDYVVSKSLEAFEKLYECLDKFIAIMTKYRNCLITHKQVVACCVRTYRALFVAITDADGWVELLARNRKHQLDPQGFSILLSGIHEAFVSMCVDGSVFPAPSDVDIADIGAAFTAHLVSDEAPTSSSGPIR